LLSDHEKRNSKEYFYKIRNFDRMPNLALSNVQRAARTIYLNKTCYNGLYRVNSSGQFNVPFGNYKNPKILDKENILDIHNFMVKSNVKITNLDFDSAVKKAKKGDIIYFDPPYDYEDQEGFVNYIKEGFTREDLVRLKNTCDNLIKKGCLVLISNNDTKFVRSLFKGDNFEIVYETQNIYANRTINSNVKMRKNAKEVLIYGKYKSGI
jgi:DNA adenine methylase